MLRERLDKADIERLYLLAAQPASGFAMPSCRWSTFAGGTTYSICRAWRRRCTPLFRDVTDHVRRVQEDIDSLARGSGLYLRSEPDDRPIGADGDLPQSSPPGQRSWQCRRQLPVFTG